MEKLTSPLLVTNSYHGSKPDNVLVHQKRVRVDRKQRSPRGFHLSSVIIFLTFTCVLVNFGLGLLYIQQLQGSVTQLEQRVQALEQGCQQKLDRNVEKNQEVQIRSKRSTEEEWPDESEHIQREHHGIPSHNIALIHGNATKVRLEANTYPFMKLRDADANKDHCGSLYTSQGQKWCSRTLRRNYDRFMTGNGNSKYYYFSSAPWMDEADHNYKVGWGGQIEVKKHGIYIVHASIHFSDLEEGQWAHFNVMMKSGAVGRPKLLTRCALKVERHGHDVYPCQVWQLESLKKDTIIYMDIGPHAWFRVEKETFHLAIIRLNGGTL